MKKRHAVVCICLGGLVWLAGCTGAEPAPRQRPAQSIRQVEDVPPVENVPPSNRGHELAPAQAGDVRDTSCAAEPNETPIPDVAERIEGNGVSDPNDMKAAQPDDVVEPQTPPSQGPVEPNFVEGYTRLLHDYVHEDGAVDYGSLHRRRLDVKQLLMRLDELDPNAYAAWPDSGKLAFWINAYNLKMLDIILRNYPIESSWWLRLTWPPSDIRHIQGIWADYKFVVMEEEFTLAEVERRFFHRTFNDPRVYLAVAYASRSSPALRRRPYDGENLDRQLDEQVKAFLAGGQGLRIDRQEMVVRLSALFKPTWRGKEFLPRYGTDKKFKDRDPETRAVLSFLTNYLSRDDAYFLETENYTIEYTNFDWRLNDTSRNH